MTFITRDVPPRAAWALTQAGISPLLARLFAARGITHPSALQDDLALLIPPSQLPGAQAAAELLTDALLAQKRVCIVADYDSDGATACATGLLGLRALGFAQVDFWVPDRIKDGYGLTPDIAQRVFEQGTDVLVTVDNGIASIEGVAHARALGMHVLITDHHLPAVVNGQAQLPADCVIVNPNVPGSDFASPSMAGVGVMFYVLLQLRAHLRSQGHFNAHTQPKLDALLPLVALGTVADVVKLDDNNRRLVSQGLKRIRAGQMPVGMAALFRASGRVPATATANDLGFGLGPRLNAAGRLSDMRLGIACLTAQHPDEALKMADLLNEINTQRRAIEADMKAQALILTEPLLAQADELPEALVVHDTSFHEGVIGIVASRLKDQLHRPVFVFADNHGGEHGQVLKGSGRSIAGLHLRDALDLMEKRHPGLLLRFGGHAAAAGCTIAASQLEAFREAFGQVAREWLDKATLQRRVLTDGPLAAEDRTVQTVQAIEAQVWGQGFGAPLFCDEVEVVSQRVVKQAHLSLKLKHHGWPVDAIWFGRTEPLPDVVTLAYRLSINTWMDQQKVQFVVEAAQA